MEETKKIDQNVAKRGLMALLIKANKDVQNKKLKAAQSARHGHGAAADGDISDVFTA